MLDDLETYCRAWGDQALFVAATTSVVFTVREIDAGGRETLPQVVSGLGIGFLSQRPHGFVYHLS